MWGTNDDVFMARYSAFNPYSLRHRDMGFQKPIGAGDAIAKSLYCGMKPIYCWSNSESNTPTGGIFNLEFSPEGSLLVAACEKKAIQVFDPFNQHRIHFLDNAHADCINCIKFLDSRMFATCSDDTTIALWDVRNLGKRIRTLMGHSKWVKNIEFSQKDKLLVTSGLDGSIYSWDIDSYSEYNVRFRKIFHTTSLMRCRLSPDAKQMVMSTTGGLIVLIHDLNLNTFFNDLMGFKPNLYRLMQLSQQLIPIASKYDYLFSADRKENRVEFISDFPDGNDAEVVSSLQIHPQGWTALSRNISHNDRSEWTCIHDIQPIEKCDQKGTRDRSPSPPPGPAPRRRRGAPLIEPVRQLVRRSPRLINRGQPYNRFVAPRRRTRRQVLEVEPIVDGENLGANTGEEERERELVAGPSREPDFVPAIVASADAAASRLRPGIQNDLWEASITLKQHRLLQEIFRRGSVRRSFNMQRITGINTGITPPPPPPNEQSVPYSNERPSMSGRTPERQRTLDRYRMLADRPEMTTDVIIKNKPRLLYHIEETNQGKGFIKELCYSSDGRVVCSPFGKGIRLLALDENCSEISSVIQDFDQPSKLHEIGQSFGHHSDLVVCAKFNPRFHMLVSGCLEGKVVWYQPFSGESL